MKHVLEFHDFKPKNGNFEGEQDQYFQMMKKGKCPKCGSVISEEGENGNRICKRCGKEYKSSKTIN
jgi:DNA-directed RNA polymerase subunit M/transcription elongation factor TFIIS